MVFEPPEPDPGRLPDRPLGAPLAPVPEGSRAGRPPVPPRSNDPRVLGARLDEVFEAYVRETASRRGSTGVQLPGQG
nr:hypothetical protein OG409_20165 [Streptomyces sp. NBC_00974]